MKPINLLIVWLSAAILAATVTATGQTTPSLQTNQKIAFTSDRDGNSEIYLMNSDGSGQTRITNNRVRDDYPTWSPDGTKIAFLRQMESGYSINLMNADGTNAVELTTVVLNNGSAYPYERFAMSWSPDGEKLAFQDGTDIYTINIDGTGRANLTNGQFINYEPTWSPDGLRIAFSRSLFSHGSYPEIFTMKADGTDVRQNTDSEDYCESRSPDWSRAGDRIVFADCVNIDPYSISVVNPDGTDLQRILPYANSPVNNMPKWSPDGQKIVFYRNSYCNPVCTNSISQIWAMNKDGSGLIQLTNATPNNFHPDWQPLAVKVANLEELYSAVNDPQNAGSDIVVAPGIYMLSATDPGGAARPNGGRLELQANMSMTGLRGDRGAVVIDAFDLPASSYTGDLPNSGAIRTGKGSNAVEWLTIRNAFGGGAGIIVHLSAAGTTFVRIAHCVSTGSQRGIDIRNVATGTTGYVIQANIVDNDLYFHRGLTAQGIRIVNAGGVSGNSITAHLNGNRIFDSQVGLLAQSIGGTDSASVSVFSTGDRFYDNGGGVVIAGGFANSNNNTTNFTAVGSIFENNNAPFTDFYPGGLSVVGSISFQTPNGGSNNTANVTLRTCRFTNNQVADLSVFGASSTPVSIGPSGSNNRATVLLTRTSVPRLIKIDSDPANPAGMNSALVLRSLIFNDAVLDAGNIFKSSSRVTRHSVKQHH